jgi:hypothetical protein
MDATARNNVVGAGTGGLALGSMMSVGGYRSHVASRTLNAFVASPHPMHNWGWKDEPIRSQARSLANDIGSGGLLSKQHSALKYLQEAAIAPTDKRALAVLTRGVHQAHGGALVGAIGGSAIIAAGMLLVAGALFVAPHTDAH